MHAASLHELLRQTMEMIEANDGKAITGVPSGFAELDEMTHGLQRGEMLILAARPSMGKTAFALNIAEQSAMLGYPVGVFSLEMGRQQLVQRLLSARSGVNSQKLRRSMLNVQDYHELHKACDALQDASIYIDDTPGLTLLQMRAKARRMASKHDIKMIVIDYLQLMSSGRRAESRQVEISEISRGVKAMARELSVPVVCLSQLNRAAEQREGHRPRMSDLRESGSIEQDADVVMMLHREEYYHQANPGLGGAQRRQGRRRRTDHRQAAQRADRDRPPLLDLRDHPLSRLCAGLHGAGQHGPPGGSLRRTVSRRPLRGRCDRRAIIER